MNALLLFLLWVSPALALEVVATLPWLGDVTHRLAPDATVTVLARGTEDPHTLSPTPALMARVARADLFIEVGMNLELWSERLLDGAGNPRIRPGQAGYVRASDGVPRLEVPTDVSRARGDLHPDGNPHFWLDPLNAAIAADRIAEGLARVDPAGAGDYAQRASAFRAEIHERLFGADLVGFIGGASLEQLARAGRLRVFLESRGFSDRLGGWLGQASAGRKVVFYHQSWPYFIDRFEMDLVGIIEDRPGIAPSAGHRQRLAAEMQRQGCTLIGITSIYPERVARALAEDTDARLVALPGDVGGTPTATDYFALIDALVRELVR